MTLKVDSTSSRAANLGRSRLSAGLSYAYDRPGKLPKRQLRAGLAALQRCLLVLLAVAACLQAADPEKEVEALVASAASDLSAGNVRSFLEAFDKSMPGYEKLSTAVQGLYSQANLSCSIEVMNSGGDDTARTVTFDWILRIDFKDSHPGSLQRQKTVTCKFKKIGKKWRIVGFDPIDLFAPPGA